MKEEKKQIIIKVSKERKCLLNIQRDVPGLASICFRVFGVFYGDKKGGGVLKKKRNISHTIMKNMIH